MTAATRATVGGCAVGVAISWNLTNVGAVADNLTSAYGVSTAVVGLFTTAMFVVHAALQLPAGRRIDRVGARRAGFTSLAILTVANGLALIAPEPALVIAARALCGVGLALGFVGGIDYVRSHGGSPFAQGLFGGIGLATGGLALAVVPAVESAIGWRAPFVTGVAIALVCIPFLVLGPSDRHRRVPVPSPGVSVGGVLRDPRVLRLCGLYMASFGLTIVLGNWVVSLLTRSGGYSDEVAGLAGSLILGAAIVSRPLGGVLVRRTPVHLRYVVAGAFAAAAIGAALLAVAGPVPLSAFGAFLVGIGAGIPFSPAFAAAARLRPDAPATAVGAVNMTANALIVIGTPLLGLAFSIPAGGRIGFAVAAGLLLVAALVTPAVRELDPK